MKGIVRLDDLNMNRSSTSLYFDNSTPTKEGAFTRCNSVHAIKFKPSDFHHQKSPCKKDRFFSEEKYYQRRRLYSCPPGKENTSLFDINCLTPKLTPTVSKKHAVPIVTDKVLDAPDVVDDPPVKLIDFNSRNTLAVALGQSVYIWDDGNSALLMEADSPITNVCWTYDGLVISARGEVELWDPIMCQMIRPFPAHFGKCGASSFIGHRLSTGGTDGIIHITDIRSGETVSYEAHNGAVSSLSWSSDGIHFASGGSDSKVVIWGDQKKLSFDFNSTVYGISWISQNIFAAGESAESGDIFIATTNKTDEEHFRISSGAPISGMSYNDKWGLTISHRNKLSDWEIWAPNELKKIAEFCGHTSDIINLTGSQDGRYIATIGADETLRLWEMKNRRNVSRGSIGCFSAPIDLR